jgi:hypothetical protein
MSDIKVTATIICSGAEMHYTESPVHHPEFDNEGYYIGGYIGSDANFCAVCDEASEVFHYKLG